MANNADIRLDVHFFDHIKIKRLQRSCGAAGVVALLRLWLWAATFAETGDLDGMTRDEIGEISGFDENERGVFVDELETLRLLDNVGGNYRIHGWKARQGWVIAAQERSDAGRLSRLKALNPAAADVFFKEQRRGITAEEYQEAMSQGTSKAP